MMKSKKMMKPKEMYVKEMMPDLSPKDQKAMKKGMESMHGKFMDERKKKHGV